MRWYLSTVFLSAFLLFLVQPLVAKVILPWFGGGAPVWTVCLVFFQASLLAGYAYAHLLATRVPPRAQLVLHGALILVSLLCIPIGPEPGAWTRGTSYTPIRDILWILAVSTGGPFLLLSATTPLVQHWFVTVFPGRSVYRLYAVSNAGSLIALLSYPFVVEPRLPLRLQGWSWSILYLGFAVLIGVAGTRFVRAHAARADAGPGAAPDRSGHPGRESVPRRPRVTTFLFWMALAAFPSAFLLATTTQLSEQVTAFPFLWILPLSLYLGSFILTFDHPRWYRRRILGPLLLVLASATAWVLDHQNTLEISTITLVYTGTLFIACMCCHGELARRKPHPRFLTTFYLAVAGGGALGGAAVSLGAPFLLPGYGEFQVALILCVFLSWVGWVKAGFNTTLRLRLLGASTLAWVLVLMYHVLHDTARDYYAWEAVSRDFYGVVRIKQYRNPWGTYRTMVHGRIQHGTQYLNDRNRRRPTTYYSVESGVGRAFQYLRERREADGSPRPIKAGIVGLGVGTLTAYLESIDSVRYYEIDPQVVRYAQTYFTFLRDSRAKVDMVLGDARLSLSRELAEGRPQGYDILVIDAFSSHAIPVHLLTQEAGAIYSQHLKPDGILAIHVTHTYLDLAPVAFGLAAGIGADAVLIDDGESPYSDHYASQWVLITRDRRVLEDEAIRRVAIPMSWSRQVRWTDDFASLWPLIRGG